MKQIGNIKMSADSDLPAPPGWGTDELTQFFDLARANQYATFVHKRPVVDRLVALDRCFMTISADWTNPQGLVPANLLLRTHSAFRAAAAAAMAGQTAETYPLVRSALEYAAYALRIHDTPGLAEIWLRRHDDDAGRKAVLKAFTMAYLRTTIASKNRKAAEVYSVLYERSIDFGGHPNERAITGNMDMVKHDDHSSVAQIYLQGDGPALDQALKTVAQAGVCCLEVLQEVFPARFELLGVRAEILNLRRGL